MPFTTPAFGHLSCSSGCSNSDKRFPIPGHILLHWSLPMHSSSKQNPRFCFIFNKWMYTTMCNFPYWPHYLLPKSMMIISCVNTFYLSIFTFQWTNISWQKGLFREISWLPLLPFFGSQVGGGGQKKSLVNKYFCQDLVRYCQVSQKCTQSQPWLAVTL